MADVTIKRIDQLESHGGQGNFNYAGKGLGVASWGMNVLRVPAGWSDYPDHDHSKDGQEEVYIVLVGSARLQAGGEEFALEPGVLARVGPGQKRKIVPGPQRSRFWRSAAPGQGVRPRS
jgi:mannose-6-phosphate isomerase-like protein (cupin superfamily)